MKNLLSVFAVLLLVTFINTDSLAQVEYKANANHVAKNLGTKSLVILYTNVMSRNKLETSKSLDLTLDVSNAEAALEYDNKVSKEFGSYINPYDNHMRIIPTDDTKYTKIQIIKKGTGISVVKERIGNGKNLIDMTTIEPGQYVLILTNEERNIYSEEITIL